VFQVAGWRRRRRSRSLQHNSCETLRAGKVTRKGREREKLADAAGGRHKTSAPHLSSNQPVRFQQGIGGRYGGPIQAQLTSQFRVAGKRLPFGRAPDSIIPFI